jgi:hypothetical protein
MFQHMIAKGHLAIGSHYHLAVAPHANHGSRMDRWVLAHCNSLFPNQLEHASVF